MEHIKIFIGDVNKSVAIFCKNWYYPPPAIRISKKINTHTHTHKQNDNGNQKYQVITSSYNDQKPSCKW